MFHNEAWGGEKFFQLLNKLAENPGGNRDLLEFLYVCLALGFEGRYRVVANGRQQLEALRERLAQILRNQGSGYERDLSPHWRGFTTKSAPVLGSLRPWIVASVCSALLLMVYLTLNLTLNRASDPVFTAIQAIGVQAAVPRQAPAAKPRLATFLKPEIDAGLVEVRDEELRSVIMLRGDGLFEPGSAIIPDKARPLLRRIAEALGAVRGNVLVTGHTDSQPIRSVRFPSNWHLSQERARSVTEFLRTSLPSTPLTAEGRADAEAIAPNDTPANRSKNRRVEITLFVARPG
jgi:type VI secretion system protein ImpK